MKDRKLAIIAGQKEQLLHFVQMIFHWSKQLSVFTNGLLVSKVIKPVLEKHEVKLFERKIKTIENDTQQCTIQLINGQKEVIDGGFLMPELKPNLNFAKDLSLELNDRGRIYTDEFGHTSHRNIYATGDINTTFAEQLVHAASSGSKVAAGIVREIASSNFDFQTK